MPQNAFFSTKSRSSGQQKNDADTFFPTLHALSPVIFATATVVAFVLLRNSRFNLHYYTQHEATPTQKSPQKWRCNLSQLLAWKITKSIHSCKTSFTELPNSNHTQVGIPTSVHKNLPPPPHPSTYTHKPTEIMNVKVTNKIMVFTKTRFLDNPFGGTDVPNMFFVKGRFFPSVYFCFNPFTAPACKISRMKGSCKQYIFWSYVFNAMYFDENPFTC